MSEDGKKYMEDQLCKIVCTHLSYGVDITGVPAACMEMVNPDNGKIEIQIDSLQSIEEIKKEVLKKMKLLSMSYDPQYLPYIKKFYKKIHSLFSEGSLLQEQPIHAFICSPKIIQSDEEHQVNIRFITHAFLYYLHKQKMYDKFIQSQYGTLENDEIRTFFSDYLYHSSISKKNIEYVYQCILDIAPHRAIDFILFLYTSREPEIRKLIFVFLKKHLQVEHLLPLFGVDDEVHTKFHASKLFDILHKKGEIAHLDMLSIHFFVRRFIKHRGSLDILELVHQLVDKNKQEQVIVILFQELHRELDKTGVTDSQASVSFYSSLASVVRYTSDITTHRCVVSVYQKFFRGCGKEYHKNYRLLLLFLMEYIVDQELQRKMLDDLLFIGESSDMISLFKSFSLSDRTLRSDVLEYLVSRCVIPELKDIFFATGDFSFQQRIAFALKIQGYTYDRFEKELLHHVPQLEHRKWFLTCFDDNNIVIS